MGTFLLILQIISSIPTLIKIVREIMKYFNDLDRKDKEQIKLKLKEAIRKNKIARQVSSQPTIAKDLEAILIELQEKHGLKR